MSSLASTDSNMTVTGNVQVHKNTERSSPAETSFASLLAQQFAVSARHSAEFSETLPAQSPELSAPPSAPPENPATRGESDVKTEFTLSNRTAPTSPYVNEAAITLLFMLQPALADSPHATERQTSETPSARDALKQSQPGIAVSQQKEFKPRLQAGEVSGIGIPTTKLPSSQAIINTDKTDLTKSRDIAASLSTDKTPQPRQVLNLNAVLAEPDATTHHSTNETTLMITKHGATMQAFEGQAAGGQVADDVETAPSIPLLTSSMRTDVGINRDRSFAQQTPPALPYQGNSQSTPPLKWSTQAIRTADARTSGGWESVKPNGQSGIKSTESKAAILPPVSDTPGTSPSNTPTLPNVLPMTAPINAQLTGISPPLNRRRTIQIDTDNITLSPLNNSPKSRLPSPEVTNNSHSPSESRPTDRLPLRTTIAKAHVNPSAPLTVEEKNGKVTPDILPTNATITNISGLVISHDKPSNEGQPARSHTPPQVTQDNLQSDWASQFNVASTAQDASHSSPNNSSVIGVSKPHDFVARHLLQAIGLKSDLAHPEHSALNSLASPSDDTALPSAMASLSLPHISPTLARQDTPVSSTMRQHDDGVTRQPNATLAALTETESSSTLGDTVHGSMGMTPLRDNSPQISSLHPVTSRPESSHPVGQATHATAPRPHAILRHTRPSTESAQQRIPVNPQTTPTRGDTPVIQPTTVLDAIAVLAPDLPSPAAQPTAKIAELPSHATTNLETVTRVSTGLDNNTPPSAIPLSKKPSHPALSTMNSTPDRQFEKASNLTSPPTFNATPVTAFAPSSAAKTFKTEALPIDVSGNPAEWLAGTMRTAPPSTPNIMQTVIHAPMGSRAWPEELAQQITIISQSTHQTAELHLNPPEQGPINVVLKMADQQISATFTSPHSAVRTAIENSLPQLRDMLANSGLTLGNASVNDQAARDQGSAAFMNQHRQTSKNEANSGSGQLKNVAPSPQTPLLKQRLKGVVDTFV